MRYLVTGAAGFIGSHMLKSFTEQGHTVLGLDNFNSYYSPSLKRARVSTFLEPLGVTVKDVSLEDQANVNTLIRKYGPDKVFHFAAQPGVRLPLMEYPDYVNRNLVAFSNLIQACVSNETPDFIYASSSSVYGNLSGVSSSELNDQAQPISFYGATKLAGEILAKTIVRNTSTRARGLRLFTVYGPWGRPDMAYFRLIASTFSNYRFQMYGDGAIKRDFTNIKDVIALTSLLAAELSTHESGFHDVVNIGGGNSVSMINMIQVLESLLGKTLDLEKYRQDPNDVNYTNADATYLSSLVGQVPSIDLRSGLEEVLKWASGIKKLDLLRVWAESVK